LPKRKRGRPRKDPAIQLLPNEEENHEGMDVYLFFFYFLNSSNFFICRSRIKWTITQTQTCSISEKC